jgi:hypothetical protein
MADVSEEFTALIKELDDGDKKFLWNVGQYLPE